MSLTKFGKKLLCFLALVAFGFAIVACQNSGDVNEPSEAQQLAEEHVEEIYGKIFWDETAMSDISSNLTLVTKTMYEDTTVSWASSHADIISPEGVVTRPSYDHEEAVSVNPNDPEEKDKHVAVELRATIKATYEEDGEVKEAIKYKEFTFTVLCLAEGLKVTSIAEAKAAGTNAQAKADENAGLIGGLTTRVGANETSLSAHGDRLTALETKVGDGFTPVTNQEIDALFA